MDDKLEKFVMASVLVIILLLMSPISHAGEVIYSYDNYGNSTPYYVQSNNGITTEIDMSGNGNDQYQIHNGESQ